MKSNDSGEVRAETTEGERFVDWNRDDVVPLTVVEAVAVVTEQDPTEMAPISEVIETDALDALFESTNRSPRMSGSVEFEYADCLVRVSAAGKIGIVPPGRW
jgi:hypothetical protein